MSLVRAARVDKKLIAHLSHGGDIDDPMSSLLVTELIRESLENEKIGRAVRHHGLSNKLLVDIYKESFEELLPDPLIRHGIAPILVPSLLFIDATYLPRVLDMCVTSTGAVSSQEIRNRMIVQSAVDFIVGLRDTAEAQGKIKQWPMLDSPTLDKLERTKGGGCLGLVLLFASLGGGAIAALNYT